MCERARRSRDASSRYSIDTLFPGLSNNSTHSRSSGHCGLGLGLGTLSTSTESSHDQLRSSTRNRRNINSDSGESVIPATGNHRSGNGNGVGDSLITTGEANSNDSNNGVYTSNVNSNGSTAGAVTTPSSGSKKRAGSPLKPATQPKQISLLSTTKMSRKTMLEVFQPWVLQTYGDSAKTKTITKKKYYRIVKTLRGEEINNAENSKFRFWVKAKGFHIGPPPGYSPPKDDLTTSYSNEPDLFVPTTVKDGSSNDKPIYKRVAVVEYFFDIIYTVHVETEAKNGKHAGQKRTYRAITEKYAFLPREAVTKFLLQCMDCQKRGSPGGDSNGNGKIVVDNSPSPDSTQPGVTSVSLTPNSKKINSTTSRKSKSPPAFDINFSLPFTTTYLRQQQQQLKLRHGLPAPDHVDDDEDTHMSDLSSVDDDHDHHPKVTSRTGRSKNGEGKIADNTSSSEIPAPVEWLGYHPIGLKKEPPPPPTTTACSNNNIYSNGKHDFREQSSPLSLSDRSAVNHEPGQDETSSNGNKDDEDDDDDESEDKMDTQQHDPERLKAFNMFVRLFVDENLDRMVPISKQPKEKIQAIIDSCTRQFPEFAERARKRIRTYLKSCRRNKRSRDTNGWESSRPTPAHLTSVQAEQILAQACENESQNAKRMRMGLEPVGQPLPIPTSESRSSENGHHTSGSSSNSSPEKGSKSSSSLSRDRDRERDRERDNIRERDHSSAAAAIAAVAAGITSTTVVSSSSSSISSVTPASGTASATPTESASNQNLNLSLNGAVSVSSNENLLSSLPSAAVVSKAMERSPLIDYSRALNGNGVPNMSMYRPNFGQAFQRPAPFPGLFPTGAAAGGTTPTFTHNVSPLPVANEDAGPTDLSMKAKPLLTHKLSSTELATVRQLITGYRESAAFLLRSADELEQLLIQQQ